MNLEQQKKQARELLRAIRAGDADALARLRALHQRWVGIADAAARRDIALNDAQFAIAREQGFTSWTKLKAYAEPPAHSRHTHLVVADMEWIAERVRGLLQTRQSSGPAALEQIREWHPCFAGRSDEEIRQAPFSEADAQLVYAREHGFESWDDLARRVNAVAADPGAAASEPFLAAFAALKSADAAALQRLLKANPRLALDRGTNGNTLLNLAVSIAAGIEPDVGLALVESLLAAGADVNDANDRGATPLHQAGYSNQSAIAAALIEKGADPDSEAHGSGGTPLVFALFWGHREVSEVLARHSVAPENLRTCAGLGSQDLMDLCFTTQTTLTSAACAARGFYRPHSGFQDWQPRADPQEVLDEALVWACKSGRTEVLPRLVRAGARLDADPYRGTALIWAAWSNRIDTAAWLIDHGATVNLKGTFGGPSHGQGVTALHMACQNGHLAMVQLLIERGADRALPDDLYHATAEGHADFWGQDSVRDYLCALGKP